MSFSLPFLTFVFTQLAILISSLWVVSLELLSPARRKPSIAFALRARALMQQQWAALILVVLAIVMLAEYLPDASGVLWACPLLLLLSLLPSFWLRKIDFMQAIHSVNWQGAQKRSQQLQWILWGQSFLSLLSLVLGLSFETAQTS